MAELRRTGQDNGDALIEHFMAKASVSVEYINQQKEMWDEFLAFFGSGDPDMFDTDEELEEQQDDRNTEVREQEMEDFHN